MKTYPYLVLRGGSWIISPRGARVAIRYRDALDRRSSYVGLRLVRSKR
jgi:formylglycine-generating enzyme required for sulfatase activity